MNPEDLQDALQYVDEDMLQAVEALRGRKAQHRHRWRQWAAVAACVCIAVITAVAANHWPSDGLTADTAPNNAWMDSGSLSEEDEDIRIDDENPEDNGETSWALIQIDEWQTDGFRGRVTDATSADHLAVGEAVEVRLKTITPTTGITLKGNENDQNETPVFPTGSVVRVWFAVQEVETEKGNTVTRHILYATDITPENAE